METIPPTRKVQFLSYADYDKGQKLYKEENNCTLEGTSNLVPPRRAYQDPLFPPIEPHMIFKRRNGDPLIIPIRDIIKIEYE